MLLQPGSRPVPDSPDYHLIRKLGVGALGRGLACARPRRPRCRAEVHPPRRPCLRHGIPFPGGHEEHPPSQSGKPVRRLAPGPLAYPRDGTLRPQPPGSAHRSAGLKAPGHPGQGTAELHERRGQRPGRAQRQAGPAPRCQTGQSAAVELGREGSGFQVDAAELVIDPAKGQYWCLQMPGFRYREALSKLQERVGTSQFLWCYTVRGSCIRPTEDVDLVEWELNVSESQILRFFRSHVWEAIVRSDSNGRENLFVVGKPELGEDIDAVVLAPVALGTASAHGLLRPAYSKDSLKYAREVADRSRNLPASERQVDDL